MRFGICSFSFHRLLADGRQDIFSYMKLCAHLGCAQLDPWNAHLAPPSDARAVLDGGRNPSRSHELFAPPDPGHIDRIARAAREIGMPFGTIAVDGAHIYEPTEEARAANRERAHAWLAAAHALGARQVRIDAGGPEQMPDDVFAILVAGYRELIARAAPLGIEILIENHWGPAVVPENLLRILDAAPGLGLLYDTRNWKPGRAAECRRVCAPRARATHVKVRKWDASGPADDGEVLASIEHLLQGGYRGVWGIESVPEDGDELAGVRRTIDLLRRRVPRESGG